MALFKMLILPEITPIVTGLGMAVLSLQILFIAQTQRFGER